MRKRFEQQLEIGGQSIHDVKIDKRSRHELPQLLSGIQYIFVTPEINEQVFEVLETKILSGKKETGRLGMSLWEILVLGLVRLNLNIDYDMLQDYANQHEQVRGIMGVHKFTSDWREKKYYPLQTIKDNVGLLDEKAIKQISDIVVASGHKLKKKEIEESAINLEVKDLLGLELKADSFVVESNIHFPTDLWLLFDSVRKCLDTIVLMKKDFKFSNWGKIQTWYSKLEKAYRAVSRIHRKKGANYKDRLKASTKLYLAIVREISERVIITLMESNRVNSVTCLILSIELETYHKYLLKLEDQVNRRILKGEKIPQSEKIYSIFEPHVEWLSKGKAGKEVELGHNVLITTDQFHFIVDHQVMIKQVDKEVAIELGKRLAEKFKEVCLLKSISLDRGFYSLPAKEYLSKIFDQVVLPKPGKKTLAQQMEESQEDFEYLRKKHSGVEANINELEHCGADKVPDKGLKGFKKYVAWSVLSYNIKRLGKIVIEKELLPTVRYLNQAA